MLIIEDGICLEDETQQVYTCSKCGRIIGFRYKNNKTGEITNDDATNKSHWWNYCCNCGKSLHEHFDDMY